MFSSTDYDRIARSTVVTSDGHSLGAADALYLDDTSDAPTWVTVHTGLLGLRTHVVPLRDATLDGEQLRVPYTKDEITSAPTFDESGHLSPEDETELVRHYGRGDGGPSADPRMRRYGTAGVGGSAGAAAAAGLGSDRPLLDSDRDGRGPVGEVLDGPDALRRGDRPLLDSDRDGRGPVGEVLDGPDRRDGDYNERGPVSERLDGPDPYLDRQRDRDLTRRDDLAPGSVPGGGGVLDSDRDGRGPVGEVLDGPDARGLATHGGVQGGRGLPDVWDAVDDIRSKLDEVLRRLDNR